MKSHLNINKQESKSLILFFNVVEDETMRAINANEGMDACCIFQPVNKILRAIRRIHIYSNIPGISIWLANWKLNIREYENVVCIASNYSYRILKWIIKKNPEIKAINYFWDSISISNYKICKIEGIENWTFDAQDSKTYLLKYNPQFYVKQNTLPKNNIKYDVVFVGSDRNGVMTERRHILSNLYIMFQKLAISSKICVLTTSNDIIPDIKTTKFIDSSEYNNIISQGKVMIDIVEPGEEWMTLRPLLALSNQKKVITNNIYIKKEPYYSKENVFILGADKEDDLKDFIMTAFQEIPKEVMEYYEVREWIKRFK